MMAKNYFYITILLFSFITFSGNAQENKTQLKTQDTSIDGLSSNLNIFTYFLRCHQLYISRVSGLTNVLYYIKIILMNLIKLDSIRDNSFKSTLKISKKIMLKTNARSRSRTCERLRESILSRSPLTTWVFSLAIILVLG